MKALEDALARLLEALCRTYFLREKTALRGDSDEMYAMRRRAWKELDDAWWAYVELKDAHDQLNPTSK